MRLIFPFFLGGLRNSLPYQSNFYLTCECGFREVQFLVEADDSFPPNLQLQGLFFSEFLVQFRHISDQCIMIILQIHHDFDNCL
jgi:hypothetical protein